MARTSEWLKRLVRLLNAKRVRVDTKADAVYLKLTDRPVHESEEVADGIVVDYDAEGRIVGVEIPGASRRRGDAYAFQNFSLDIPGVS